MALLYDHTNNTYHVHVYLAMIVVLLTDWYLIVTC